MKIVISKQGDVRKQELLDAALELFYQKGYAETTIKEIHDKVCVTKGAFYYYFTSKEDVLDAITIQLAEKTVRITEEIADNPDLNALDKINTIVSRVYEHRIKNIQAYSKLFHIVESDSNILFRQRLLKKILKMVQEPYTKIVRQGIAEGLFHTDFEEDICELIIYLGDFYRRTLAYLFLDSENKEKNVHIIKRKARFFQSIVESIFGLNAGTTKVARNLLKVFGIQ
jgi:AcrR family transcriptional regulator